MPETQTAVVCKQCGRLHPVGGVYIIVTATVTSSVKQTHRTGPLRGTPSETPADSVAVTDVAVCNNKCLTDLLSLRTHA